MRFDSTQKIGKIVSDFPKASDVFKEYRIDFCCGGDRPLIEAIKELGLNEAVVVNRLNELFEKVSSVEEQGARNWQEAPLDELVDHIINKHHAYLWSELPKISELTTKILRVHGLHHPELTQVHKLFHTVKMELESHLSKEEAIQYPAIKKFVHSRAQADLTDAIRIIQELEEEHVGAGDILKELRQITKDYQVPDDGCGTYDLTYLKLVEMESDIFEHIHLENNILFPRLFQLQKEA